MKDLTFYEVFDFKSWEKKLPVYSLGFSKMYSLLVLTYSQILDELGTTNKCICVSPHVKNWVFFNFIVKQPGE